MFLYPLAVQNHCTDREVLSPPSSTSFPDNSILPVTVVKIFGVIFYTQPIHKPGL